MLRLQSALEYITVYGWAILIIAVVLSTFLYLGVFSPGAFISSQCTMPADFSCLTAVLSQNGQLLFNIQQSTLYSINLTAIGCNTQQSYAAMTVLTPNVPLNIGGNHTFTNLQCYNGTTAYSGSVGSLFTGYLIINYTDVQTGFPKTQFGSLVQKVI